MLTVLDSTFVTARAVALTVVEHYYAKHFGVDLAALKMAKQDLNHSLQASKAFGPPAAL
jgi:hypothetical protein